VPRLGELYPGICLTTEEKARKNLSQGSWTIRIHRPNSKNAYNYSIKQEYNHILIKIEPKEYERICQ
jgi:1,4-alpha-glucan branching enzyme